MSTYRVECDKYCCVTAPRRATLNAGAPLQTRNCSLHAVTCLVYPSAPTLCGAHLPPSLLIAYPWAPPKRGEAPCLPGGAHAKWCHPPLLLVYARAHRPTSQKRRSALSSRRRPREAARINHCPCLVPSQRRPPNAAKRPFHLAAPTRTDALYRRTSLVTTLRRLPKAAKHTV